MNFAVLSSKLFKQIIQYSPPRTGSTLVFNILQELFVGYKIKKTHRYRFKYAIFPTVVTYRNPIDTIASMLLVKKLEITHDNINKMITEVDLSQPSELIALSQKNNVLTLKYEDFYRNFDYIFDNLEDFFRIDISSDSRKTISDKLNINEVFKHTKNIGSFSEYDERTLFHGEHISEYKGQIDYGSEILSTEMKNVIKEHYKLFMIHFGYL